MNISNLVLSTTLHVFPTVLRTTLRGRCEVPTNLIKQFFEIAMDRNNTTSPDIVVGACYSVLGGSSLSSLTAEIIPWAMVKAEFIETLKLLRRTSEYHASYQRLFYQLTIALCVDHVSDTLLKQFCTYMKFDGSVRYSDAAIQAFFDYAGIKADRPIMSIIDTLYTDLPADFKDRIRHRITVTLTNTLEDTTQSENGRAPNRVDILKAVQVLMTTSPPDITTCLGTGGDEDPDVWHDLTLVINQTLRAAVV